MPAASGPWQGLERAISAGAKEVAVFTAASETFNKTNTNVGIDESLKRLADVTQAAREQGVAVRGYVSCVTGCPYQVRGTCSGGACLPVDRAIVMQG